MRLVFSILLIIAIAVASIFSNMAWSVDYPETYTHDYISEHYSFADPNLIYMHRAQDHTGYSHVPGGSVRYYAIKGIDIEEYLVFRENIIMSPANIRILKSNQKDPTEQEILNWKIERVEFFTLEDDVNRYHKKYGKRIVHNRIAKIDEYDFTAVQEYMRECIDTGFYYNKGRPLPYSIQNVYKNERYVKVRFIFENHKNIVWDAPIVDIDGHYYMVFQLYNENAESFEYNFNDVYMPLYPDLASMLRDKM